VEKTDPGLQLRRSEFVVAGDARETYAFLERARRRSRPIPKTTDKATAFKMIDPGSGTVKKLSLKLSKAPV
jgi:hypothetical protein